MLNFEFYNPTRIVFGKETIGELRRLLPANTKIMMLYGGGSIHHNGVYDAVKKALEGFDYVEFGGIEPNPKYETCMKAVELSRREKVGFLLAVGGGSVLDGTKFIAAAHSYTKGDPWQLLTGEGVPEKSLPIGDVITLPATGSEMNCGAVISRLGTEEKLCLMTPLNYPVFSIIDPETTYTLPPRQTANGIVDTFIHTCEQVITYDVNSPLIDRMAFAVLRTLREQGPIVLEQPKNYDARANVFWSATIGLNGVLGTGVVQDWATHMIGHELTAFYGLDHAVTLAIIQPALWRTLFDAKREKLALMGREVFGITESCDTHAAQKCIDQTMQFFRSLGMKLRLSEHGIDAAQAAEKVRERFLKRGTRLGEHGNIDGSLAAKIILETEKNL